MEIPPKEGNIDNQVQSENWLVSVFKFIIKHYLILSSIPLILGGVHQLVKLSEIGWNYLRFFSATQLLIDGIIILVILVVITTLVLCYAWVNFVYNHSFYNNISEVHSRGTSNPIWVRNTNIVVLILVVIGFYFVRDSYNLFLDFIYLNLKGEYSNASEQYDISNGFAIVSIFTFFIIVGNCLVYDNSKYRNHFTQMLSLMIWMPFALFVGKSLQPIHLNDFKIFSGLEQVGNYQNHNENMKDRYPNYSNTKLLYFNDKFIFTELSSPNDKMIIITTIDDFLELN